MSFGYYVLLCRELEAQDIRHHFPAAAIQAVLVNLKRDPDKSDAADPWDFMPGWEKAEEPEDTEAETDAKAVRCFALLDAVIGK